MLGKSDDEEIRAQAPRWAGKISPDLPFEVLAHHAVDFWLCGEDLPQADNRVTVDGDGAIHLSLDEKQQRRGCQAAAPQARRNARATWACTSTTCSTAASTCTRACRSARQRTRQAPVRFGTDPAASALDVNCKAHDVDNLYVVDTSFFPSIGAVNPSLTAIANALWVGDHITERLA